MDFCVFIQQDRAIQDVVLNTIKPWWGGQHSCVELLLHLNCLGFTSNTMLGTTFRSEHIHKHALTNSLHCVSYVDRTVKKHSRDLRGLWLCKNILGWRKITTWKLVLVYIEAVFLLFETKIHQTNNPFCCFFLFVFILLSQNENS